MNDTTTPTVPTMDVNVLNHVAEQNGESPVVQEITRRYSSNAPGAAPESGNSLTNDNVAEIRRLFHSNEPNAAYEIGKLLFKERQRHERGTWLPWAKGGNLPFGYTLAMRLIENYKDHAPLTVAKVIPPKPTVPRVYPEGWDVALRVAEVIQDADTSLAGIPRTNLANHTLALIRRLKVAATL